MSARTLFSLGQCQDALLSWSGKEATTRLFTLQCTTARLLTASNRLGFRTGVPRPDIRGAPHFKRYGPKYHGGWVCNFISERTPTHPGC